jgi:4-hydroxy-4-methyl-2-oxoglutarate aldolase
LVDRTAHFGKRHFNHLSRFMCAGQIINPGDAIVADDDGVVVVPRVDAETVLAKGVERENLEEDKRKKLAAGVLGLDLYGMRPRLQECGFEYLDSLSVLDKIK